MPQELQIKYTHTNVFLAVASTEICVIPVDTAVEDLPQYNLSIITSKFVIYVLSIIVLIYIYEPKCLTHGSYFCR